MSKVYSKTRLNSDGAVTAVASFILGLHFKDSDESRSIRVTTRSPSWEILTPSEGLWHSPRQKMQIHTSEELAKKKIVKFRLSRCQSRNGELAKALYHCLGSILRPFPSKHVSLLNLQQGAMVSTRNGETDDIESIFGYILSRWPTWRTVAKNSQSHGHLHCAVCSARPLANV